MTDMKIKVLKDLPDYKAGRTVKVKTKDGIPISRFWRDRLKDAFIDNCVEIVKTKKPIIKIEGTEK